MNDEYSAQAREVDSKLSFNERLFKETSSFGNTLKTKLKGFSPDKNENASSLAVSPINRSNHQGPVIQRKSYAVN